MLNRFKKVLIIVFVLLNLFSTINFFVRTSDNKNESDAAVAKWEDRLAYAREILPVNRGTIGYIAEWDLPGARYAYWDQETEFLLTQYTFAPIILVRGVKFEWTIVVLSPDAFNMWSKSNIGD